MNQYKCTVTLTVNAESYGDAEDSLETLINSAYEVDDISAVHDPANSTCQGAGIKCTCGD